MFVNQTFTRIGRTTAALLKNRRAATAVVVAGTVLGAVGLGAAPAGAQIALGPNGTGKASGSAYCDTVHHTIQIFYHADPETTWGMNNIIPVSTSTPELLNVYAYVKLSTSNTWGAPVAHASMLASTQGTVVLNSTVKVNYPGRTYNVAYYVSLAYPNGAWSSWIWDPYTTYYDSYSGSLFAPYSYCKG